MSDPAPLRFVVLRHEMPPSTSRGSHFDLMFQSGTHLWTWAVDRWPLRPGESVGAEPLAPHRMAYLDYEGPISGGRGSVSRVAAGTYVVESPAEPSGGEAPWVVRLESPQWRGRLRIEADRVTAEI